MFRLAVYRQGAIITLLQDYYQSTFTMIFSTTNNTCTDFTPAPALNVVNSHICMPLLMSDEQH